MKDTQKLDSLLNLLTGEFANSHQYWEGVRSDIPQFEKPPHVYLTTKRIGFGDFGSNLLFSVQGLAIVGKYFVEPYRIRVYDFDFEHGDETITSRIYKLKSRDEEIKYLMAAREKALALKSDLMALKPEEGFAILLSDEALNLITPDALVLTEGCDVLWTQGDDGAFSGNTEGRQCLTRYAGATYMQANTSALSEHGFVESDVFYDDNNRAVSGIPISFVRGLPSSVPITRN